MSNYELGLLLIVVISLVCVVITICEADLRINKEKQITKDMRVRNITQSAYVVELEAKNEELQEIAKTYEQLLLEAEEAAQDVIESYKKHLKLETCTISEIATELCKREDVKHFLIDVKNDTQNYSLSGGH